MKALEWEGKDDVKVVTRPRPLITEPTDCVVRVTTTTICGSDLHMYHHDVKQMEKGDILGHEFMGIVESVGPQVKNIKIGDRVVVSAVICCGNCQYCKQGNVSLCDTTNPSAEIESLYGQRLSGIFGYSHLTGGYPGGQAEYVRIPLADMNVLKVPSNLKDEQVLFLSDIACTGWHANELGEVSEGKTVVIWGCGPVGLMAAMWAKFRGAKRVISVDGIPYRLQFAKEKLGVETINFTEVDVVDTVRTMIPGGPDVVIDAVGFRYPKSLVHKVQRSLGTEGDSPEVLIEALLSCKKGGNLAIVGDYFLYANGFPVGALMEKGITTRGSQVYVQKYWKQLLGYIEQGKVDPSFVITHVMPFEKAAEAYRMFDQKADNSIKILLKTASGSTISTP